MEADVARLGGGVMELFGGIPFQAVRCALELHGGGICINFKHIKCLHLKMANFILCKFM